MFAERRLGEGCSELPLETSQRLAFGKLCEGLRIWYHRVEQVWLRVRQPFKSATSSVVNAGCLARDIIIRGIETHEFVTRLG